MYCNLIHIFQGALANVQLNSMLDAVGFDILNLVNIESMSKALTTGLPRIKVDRLDFY